MNLIEWKDFQAVEMRVGTIIKSEIFEKAKKPAFKLWIDFGKHGIKKTSAQLTKLYKIDDLVGKQVVAVVNFPPKQIANFMSECLVLGAVDAELGVSLLSAEHRVSNGTRIA